MSRHRNVRTMNYDDEFDDYPVGSLTDEPECISPTDANQWIFDRNRGQSSLDAFLLKNEDIQEQDEDEDEEVFHEKNRRDSESFQLPELNDLDKARLLSCMEEIRNISGDSFSDKRLCDAIISCDYDYSKALDLLLTNDTLTRQQNKKTKLTEVEKEKNKAPSTSQFKLPSLGSAKLLPSSGGFVLPKLGISSTVTESSLSLSDFAKKQLDVKPDKFAIPEIFPSKDESSGNKFVIDLKAALVSDAEQTTFSILLSNEKRKDSFEDFVPKFIDCDVVSERVTSKKIIIDEQCEQLTFSHLKKAYKNLTFKNLTCVGKVIRGRFRKKVPKILHGYEHRNRINRFTFDTLSPDDKILQHLNKNKK
ncbi:CLUMA_CG012057, isoform A [Clunio marinus]|uniref:CLUMA_CG012057, isoform A n=1 Tax=Clunio marinus TaxID=568069 RepID=A0A1J1IEY9_9DIPT|nr:CLUMA_CG012057, isoform A [Clunio marinus]